MAGVAIKWVESDEGSPPTRCFDRDTDTEACERSAYDYIKTLEGCDDNLMTSCDAISSYTMHTQDRIRNIIQETGLSGNVTVMYSFGFSGPKDNIIGQSLLHRCGISIFENGHLAAEGEAIDISGSRKLVNESSTIHGSLTDCFEKATNDLADTNSSFVNSEQDMSGGTLKSTTRFIIKLYRSALRYINGLFS